MLIKNIQKKLFKLVGYSTFGIVLIKTSIPSLFLQIGGSGITLLVYILLARLLGVRDYSNYVYVLAWINILVLVAKFGLDTVLLRYVAAYEGKQDWESLHGIIVWSFRIVVLSSILIGSVLILFIWLLISYIGKELADLFLIGSSLILFFTLIDLVRSSLQGLQHVILSQFIGIVLRPVTLGIIIIILYTTGLSLSGFITILANVFATLLTLILSIFLMSYYLPSVVKSAPSLINSSEWLSTAFPLFLLSGTQIIMSQTDTVMLGIMQNIKEAGIYASASSIASFVVFGLNAFNAFLAPMISKLYTLNKKQELQNMLTVAAWGIFVFTMIASLFLIGIGKFLLFIFGEEFVTGYSSLIVIILGQVINALAGPVGFIMIMTGNQTIVAKLFVFSAALNVILNAIFIPFFGMIGAAIATSISAIFWNIALLWLVREYLGINPTIFVIGSR